MIRYVFKIYYLGNKYTGSQRQANGQGVFNHVEIAFIKSNYINSFKESKFIAMSRTDVDVSALSNVFVLELKNTPHLNKINKFLPKDNSIIIYDYAEIDADFNPRHVHHKVYKYMIENPNQEIINKLNRIKHFEGTHNFSNLIKKDGAGTKNPISNIYQIDIQKINTNFIITFKGDKFGREQIRKIIGYITDEKFLDIEPNEILIPSEIEVSSADPQFLVLFDTKYDGKIDWHFNQKILQFSNLIKNNEYSINIKLYQTSMLKFLLNT